MGVVFGISFNQIKDLHGMIEKVINSLPDELLEALSVFHQVDKKNTKLRGSVIFKGLLLNILKNRPMSLVSLEDFINDTPRLNQGLKASFTHKKQVSRSGLANRLQTMPVAYAEAIYKHLVSHYHHVYGRKLQQELHRFDSTIIKASSNLLTEGINCGGAQTDRHIKVSIGMRGSIPSSIRFCQAQEDSSEDRALAKAIKEVQISGEDIVLFDRGISKTETFQELESREIRFITRVKVNRKHHVLEEKKIPPQPSAHNADHPLIKDQVVLLYNQKEQGINCPLRLIQMLMDNEQPIWFLTNMMEMDPYSIVALYKRRWDIEVLFKFMKQHLKFKHFLSYTDHGMQTYLYLVLSAALLFFIYKKETNKSGFKRAFFSLILELERAYVIDLIILSGGDPEKVRHKL
jgi:transposase